MVHRSKTIELVFRFFVKSLHRLDLFFNDECLFSKHVINLIADVNKLVVFLVLKVVDPNHFNIIARYVNFHVKLHLVV